MQRKDFITLCIRYLLLALLGIVTLTLGLKRGDAVDASCIAGNLCSSCGKARGCNLPQKVTS